MTRSRLSEAAQKRRGAVGSVMMPPSMTVLECHRRTRSCDCRRLLRPVPVPGYALPKREKQNRKTSRHPSLSPLQSFLRTRRFIHYESGSESGGRGTIPLRSCRCAALPRKEKSVASKMRGTTSKVINTWRSRLRSDVVDVHRPPPTYRPPSRVSCLLCAPTLLP